MKFSGVSASDSDFNEENVFLVHRLKKSYGKVEAVKNVSFRVKKNECFGLLGVNGAGKSSTFRMLVGEEIPSSGILQRGGYNMKSNRKEVNRKDLSLVFIIYWHLLVSNVMYK